MKTENMAFRDRSAYPKSRLFRPRRIRIVSNTPLSVAGTMRVLDEVVTGHTGNPGNIHTSYEMPDIGDWEQRGAFWVRTTACGHHSISGSRVGAHARWRDADGFYCCDGLPYFSAKQITRMQKTTEVFKPLLLLTAASGRKLEIAMARSIANPKDPCWGLRTLDTWYEASIDGAPSRWLSLTGVKGVVAEFKKSLGN